MADSASLIVRVTSQGVDQAAKGLDSLSKSATTADKSTAAFSKSADTGAKAASGFGNVAQQAGFQVQDMVVQLQSGTSAFVAIGQQVPQFLGAFGPIGAVTGTVVALASAIGGVLYTSMGDATVSAEELERANKQLASVLEETDYGVVGLSESLLKLAQSNEVAARSQISLALVNTKVAADAAAKSIQEAADNVDGWTNATGDFATASSQLNDLEKITKQFGITSAEAFNGEIPAKYQMGIAELGTFINTLGEEYDITSQQALELVKAQDAFNRQPTAENAQVLATTMTAITDSSSGANSEFIKLNAEVAHNAQIMLKAAGDAEALKAAQEGLKSSVEALSVATRQQNAELIESLRIQTLSGAEQVNAQAEQRKRQIDQNEAFNAEEKAQAKVHIDAMAKQQIEAIEKREAAINAKADMALSKQQANAAKSIDIEQKKQQRLLEEAQAYIDKLAYINMSDLDKLKADEQKKLDTLNEYRAQNLITEAEYQEALKAIREGYILSREELEAAAAARIEAANADIFEKEMAMIKTQEEAKAKQLEDGKEALDSMTADLRTALGENNDLYKAAAITKATIDTYTAANAAYAAMAGIPVVGPALGVAAAAAAIAAGAANVAAIASAREQGGNLAAGQMSTIAERGQPEVIMPASASRVRTAQQMRQIMGENGGSNAPTNVQIVNQTTGRVDSATTERMDEQTLRVIIRETVSGDMTDSNSSISKSRRATRGQAGF